MSLLVQDPGPISEVRHTLYLHCRYVLCIAEYRRSFRMIIFTADFGKCWFKKKKGGFCVNTHYNHQRSYLTSVSLIKLHRKYKCVSCTMLNCWTALHTCTEIRVCEWSDFKHALLTCKCSDQKRILAVTHESVPTCDLVFFGINFRLKPTPPRYYTHNTVETLHSVKIASGWLFFSRQDLLLTFSCPPHKYYRRTYNYVS